MVPSKAKRVETRKAAARAASAQKVRDLRFQPQGTANLQERRKTPKTAKTEKPGKMARIARTARTAKIAQTASEIQARRASAAAPAKRVRLLQSSAFRKR